jgi:thymidylate kinase
MFIVVEGCDGVGKSTFIDTLKRRIKIHAPLEEIEVFHHGPPKTHPLVEYELGYERYIPADGHTIICDRLHWGEEIYGPLYRGGSKLGFAGMRHVDMFLKSIGAVVVFLDLPEPEIRRRLTKTREDFLKTDDVKTVLGAYVAQAQQCTANLMMMTAPPDHQDADDVIRYASGLETKCSALGTWPTYVGSSRPRVLLLGDTRNHPTEERHRLAFVPYVRTSGRFLLEALPTSMLDMIGIANACETQNDLWTLWNFLEHPRVVALGRNAANAVDLIGAIPYAEVPHPQYVRRFHSKQKEMYGELIRYAAGRVGRFGLYD